MLTIYCNIVIAYTSHLLVYIAPKTCSIFIPLTAQGAIFFGKRKGVGWRGVCVCVAYMRQNAT